MGGANRRNINMVSHVVGLLCLLMVRAHKSEALEFTVGGQSGWTIPSDNSTNSFNQWAERTRFQIGDSLGNPVDNVCIYSSA